MDWLYFSCSNAVFAFNLMASTAEGKDLVQYFVLQQNNMYITFRKYRQIDIMLYFIYMKYDSDICTVSGVYKLVLLYFSSQHNLHNELKNNQKSV